MFLYMIYQHPRYKEHTYHHVIHAYCRSGKYRDQSVKSKTLYCITPESGNLWGLLIT